MLTASPPFPALPPCTPTHGSKSLPGESLLLLPPPLSLPGPRTAPPPARAPLLPPHSPDRPLRASGSGTALDPAPGPFAPEALESRPDPGQPPRPPLLRLRRRRSEPQTGNPPGPPSFPEPLLQLHKEPEPELPPPPARPPRPPRARLSARPARRHGRLGAARLWARGGRQAEKACDHSLRPSRSGRENHREELWDREVLRAGAPRPTEEDKELERGTTAQGDGVTASSWRNAFNFTKRCFSFPSLPALSPAR